MVPYHGIPKSTFHSYVQRYNEGVLSTTHRNTGCKRPWIGTVQVMGTIAAIVKENANQMPHQMRGIGHGRVDTLKYLPIGNNWKRVMADANEIRIIVSRMSCIGRSPNARQLLQTVTSTSNIVLVVDYVLNYSVMDFSSFSCNTLH